MTNIKSKLSNPFLSNVLKGSLLAVSVSLVLILVFALLIKFLNIPDSAIQPVNQTIKIISILLGVVVALKKFPKKGLLTGAFVGFIYTVLAFVFFSLLSGQLIINASLFIDIIFAILIGSLCGIFFVNRKVKQ